MKGLDWAVLVGTITFIVVYGVWRNRSQSTLESLGLRYRGTLPRPR